MRVSVLGGLFDRIRRQASLRIALVYLLVCGGWILFSDRLLLVLLEDPRHITRLQTYKGWFFVLATSLLLAVLIKRYTRAVEESLERARQSEERYRRLLKLSPEAVVVHTEGRIVFANDAGTRLLGAASCREVLGRRIYDFIHPDFHEPVGQRILGEQASGSGPRPVEEKMMRLDGSVIDIEVLAAPVEDGSEGTFQVIIRDISERKRVEQALRENQARLDYLAHHDTLTQLPNRVLFQDRMQHAIAKARRADTRVALIFLDLDRFKNINDSIGHEIGDQVLQEIASRMQEQIREADTLARLSGDEFVVILEGLADIEVAGRVTQRLLGAVAEAIQAGEHQLYLTASAGISLFPGDAEDIEGLLKAAESAMFRSKEQGKNTYQFFTPDMNSRARELLMLEAGLRSACEKGELVLFYQPQLDLASRRLVGFEALLRWQHPQRGMVSPAEFIPLAEETGLIVPIGEWVLETACAQARQWQRQGYPPLRMAVNISARQFHQAGLAGTVAGILERTGLDPALLELEVTESLIMKDVESAIATMKELSAMGVQLSIDDFGTGYSSLGYLKRFPISNLKIDRSFVRDVTTDSNDAEIAASVIALAHSMRLRVVAEGIETEDQLTFLRQRRCDHGQGFLFSRPLPAEALGELLQQAGLKEALPPAAVGLSPS